MKNDAPLPPIISDMIIKLGNDSLSANEKNNIASTLEIIGSNCNQAASKWRDKFNKIEAAMVNNRRNRKRVQA